ncbi:MAG: hypothetical protein O3B42_07420 [Actinomycetota bacterium]|nr:hypothetical protein [Actinomycetota bacterium]
MQTRSLHEDLLAIDGVDGAEVDGASGSPSGLRIRIAKDADQRFVGEEIRRVLSAHSLGTDTRLPGEPPINRQKGDSGQQMASVSELASGAEPDRRGATPVATSAPLADDAVEASDETLDAFESIVDLTQHQLPEHEAGSQKSTDTAAHSLARIEKVSVEEGRSGILVSVVSTDGRIQTEFATSSEGGVERAVVVASARIASPGSPTPIVIEIDERRVDGVDIIMIVLDMDGVIAAGSAVVGAGRAFALGRATWAAISV